eukprot:1694488-Rhodomonas_salina.2
MGFHLLRPLQDSQGAFGAEALRLTGPKSFFQQSGMQDLMLSGKASTDALVNCLYVDVQHTHTT